MNDQLQPASLRVVVLSGGDSPEREISLLSGKEVIEALLHCGYDVLAIDPAETRLADVPWADYDACFIALHGGAGEDGTIQAELDQLGVPYTGSGAEASRLAMDKVAAKRLWHSVGIPTPAWLTASLSGTLPTPNAEQYPVVVKPVAQGSSLGVHVAREPGELSEACQRAFLASSDLLIEQFVDGREFTVTLLDRRPLPLLEINCNGDLFGYDDKYTADRTRYEFDSSLPDSVHEHILEVAIAAAESIGGSSLCRVDIRLDAAMWPWVLELNTIPGLTRTSLAPRAARQAGMDLGQLCRWMIQSCLRRCVVA